MTADIITLTIAAAVALTALGKLAYYAITRTGCEYEDPR